MIPLLPEPDLPSGADLLAEGRALTRDWRLGPSAFLRHVGAASEYGFKLAQMAKGRVMQHAQIGFRDPGKSRRAYGEIWEACAAEAAGCPALACAQASTGQSNMAISRIVEICISLLPARQGSSPHE